MFPASSLGKETDINQGLHARHGRHHPDRRELRRRAPTRRWRSSYFPFIFRDADHLLKYAKSDVFKELTKGYDEKTGNHITALTYYGARHVTSQRGAADRQAART